MTMADTPTPRAVLARHLTTARDEAVYDYAHDPDSAALLPVIPESDAVQLLERDYCAALAASAGPLSDALIRGDVRDTPTVRDELDAGDIDGVVDAVANLYRTAYTALAAECARLRAELFEASQGPELLESCRQEIAALRATVATLQRERDDAVQWIESKPSIAPLFHHWRARTPTPERQG